VRWLERRRGPPMPKAEALPGRGRASDGWRGSVTLGGPCPRHGPRSETQVRRDLFRTELHARARGLPRGLRRRFASSRLARASVRSLARTAHVTFTSSRGPMKVSTHSVTDGPSFTAQDAPGIDRGITPRTAGKSQKPGCLRACQRPSAGTHIRSSRPRSGRR
jgi:hypothetical protein